MLCIFLVSVWKVPPHHQLFSNDSFLFLTVDQMSTKGTNFRIDGGCHRSFFSVCQLICCWSSVSDPWNKMILSSSSLRLAEPLKMNSRSKAEWRNLHFLYVHFPDRQQMPAIVSFVCIACWWAEPRQTGSPVLLLYTFQAKMKENEVTNLWGCQIVLFIMLLPCCEFQRGLSFFCTPLIKRVFLKVYLQILDFLRGVMWFLWGILHISEDPLSFHLLPPIPPQQDHLIHHSH